MSAAVDLNKKRMGMLLQDPSFEKMHEDWPFPLDRDYLDGMGSSKFQVRDGDLRDNLLHRGLDWQTADLTFGALNLRRDFIDNPQFHQVNAFAVASHTLAFVEAAIGREIRWKHGGPLVIRPHAFNEANAFYDPNSPSLNFGSFSSPFRRTPIWTCLSHDVISHELGHAILDSFRPLFLNSPEIDVSALHESIGDLLSLFSALEHKAIVEQLFRESSGDMFKPNLISGLAEEFGIGLQGISYPFLRSALAGPNYDPNSPAEPHERSTVWTAAIYELLAALVEQATTSTVKEVLSGAPNVATRATSAALSSQKIAFEEYYTNSKNRSGFDAFYEAIVAASVRVKGMLLRSLYFTPPTGVSMPTLARLIYEADARSFPNDSGPRELAKTVFQKRLLWNDQIQLAPPGIGREFQDLEEAGPAALARAVVKHADALRIPLGAGVRILAPRLVTIKRNVDTGYEMRGSGGVRTITERYLQYAYELLVPVCFPGPDGGIEMGMASVFKGGTLVMDQNWNDVILSTDPDIESVGTPLPSPAMHAIEVASRRFRKTHRHALRAFRDGIVRPDGLLPNGQPALPFSVIRQSSGSAILAGRRCNLIEHFRGISLEQSNSPFATPTIKIMGSDVE
jgi:hypothetical protein